MCAISFLFFGRVGRRVKQNRQHKQTCCSQTASATQIGITCYLFSLHSLGVLAKHHINTITQGIITTPSTEFGLQPLKNPCLLFWCIYYSTAQNIPSGVIQIAHTQELCKAPPPPPPKKKRKTSGLNNNASGTKTAMQKADMTVIKHL